MRVYISGPMTGIENDNKEAFDDAEKQLKEKGHEVVNPQSLPHDHDKSWESYMKEDIKALLECDAVFALAGWSGSRGALIEVDLADALGVSVHENMRLL